MLEEKKKKLITRKQAQESRNLSKTWLSENQAWWVFKQLAGFQELFQPTSLFELLKPNSFEYKKV